MIAVAVALDGEALIVAFDDQIDSKSADSPLRSNLITGGRESFHDLTFEGGLGSFLFFFESAHEAAGILRVLDELAAEIVGLEVVTGAKRMDDPHLVAGAAGGHVETLLEQFLIAEGQGAALGSVDEGDKDDVALVALELRGVPAQNAAKLVSLWRDVLAKEIINFNRLFVAHQRDDTKTERLTCVIFLIFRHLHSGGDQRGHRESLLTVKLAVAAGAGNAMRDGVWTELDPAVVPQGLDAPIVGNHIAELNDFRYATEMLDQTGCAAEGLAGEMVAGD